MVDKLTFSFQGNAKLRLGGQDVNLREAAQTLDYAGSKGLRPIKGFMHSDGTFFRLKEHASGRVDVIIYGEPNQLSKYRFNVRGGDLAKARLDGADYRLTRQFTRGAFTLDGRSLGASARATFLQTFGLGPRPSSSPTVPAREALPVDGLKAPQPRRGVYEPWFSIRDTGVRSTAEVAQVVTGLADDDGDLIGEHARAVASGMGQGAGRVRLEAPSSGAVQAATPEEQFARRVRDAPELANQLSWIHLNGPFEGHTADELLAAMLGQHGGMAQVMAELEQHSNEQAILVSNQVIESAGRGEAIQSALAAADLEARAVPGDGHCMFGALAYSLGGGHRETFERDPFAAAMGLRKHLLTQALRLSNAQVEKLSDRARPEDSSKVGGDKERADRARNFLEGTLQSLAGGLDIKSPDSSVWGDFRSLAVAAIAFQRPVVAIDHEGAIHVFREDGRALKFEQIENLREVLRQEERRGFTDVVVVHQPSASHWEGAAEP